MPTCIECGTSFGITEDDQRFLDDFGVPDPLSCPDCRLTRRLLERNSRKLYWRTCDLTGERILSQFHVDHPFPVFSPEAWWSDKWDALMYGRDIDFSRPFFEQFAELRNTVPHQARFVIQGTMENSDYVNNAGYSKNCYLIAEADYDEDCLYSNRVYHCKDAVDCFNCHQSEILYECLDCTECHGLFFSQDCQNCSGSFFLKSCIGCRDCIGCINQRQKRYLIMNEQLSPEEFEKRKAALRLDTAKGVAALRTRCADFFCSQPQRFVQGEHNEHSTGDHISNTRDAFHCMDCKDLEDCRYCQRVSMGVKSSMDYTFWGDNVERAYQCGACGNNVYNLKFSSMCTTNLSDCEYLDSCTGCKNCFGCVSLKKKQHCILNKQYSKEEYVILKEKLISHMRTTGEYGQFFPKSMCSFSYNESIALEYFPLTKEEAIARGYPWRDETDEKPDVKKMIPASHLPETIAEIPDDILNWAVTSEESKRPFRIVKQELAFYRAHNLPVPHLHPEERQERRTMLRPPRRLWKRPCSACGKEVESTFAVERKERVLCEECYLKEVY
ncbi:MAG: hypothetical protein PHX87_02880 [Candidatus Peribacteraceae bacterium]|nr:hypothetical protein [Candidatus Peribacteraceae bacterium]MDD5742353.1 hypothetical protein [Candidatus Peribacteraceae bacterium]